MKKQLNVEVIASELRGGSAFFPGYKGSGSQSPTPTDDIQTVEPQRPPEEPKQVLPERSNARTPVRPNAKRIITRNSFEIYEDQMDSLRKLSYLEKVEGRIGSMSQMVREAIDTYLKEKTTKAE